MNKAALFCDGTEGYVYPPEPKENELVTFRFRTAKDDADRVGLVTSADTYVMEKNAHRENLIIIRLKCVWGRAFQILFRSAVWNRKILLWTMWNLSRDSGVL